MEGMRLASVTTTKKKTTTNYASMTPDQIAAKAQELANKQAQAYATSINAARDDTIAEYNVNKKDANKAAANTGTALRREYDSYVNPYGVQGEKRAEYGFGNTGYGEVLNANAWSDYLSQRGSNLNNLRNQLDEYNRGIAQAKRDAKAQIADKQAALYDKEYEAMMEARQLQIEEEQRQWEREQAALAEKRAQEAHEMQMKLYQKQLKSSGSSGGSGGYTSGSGDQTRSDAVVTSSLTPDPRASAEAIARTAANHIAEAKTADKKKALRAAIAYAWQSGVDLSRNATFLKLTGMDANTLAEQVKAIGVNVDTESVANNRDSATNKGSTNYQNSLGFNSADPRYWV